MPLADRLQDKYAVNPLTGCWEWTASLNNGYGQLHSKGCTYRAHRVSYEAAKGPIPTGLQLDHLCRVPRCINPDHLEPVSNRENTIRGDCPAVNRERQSSKTHCKHGHPLSGDNVHVNARGFRTCRACAREKARRHNGGATGRASCGPLREIVGRSGAVATLVCGHTLALTNRNQRRARCPRCDAGYRPVEDVTL